MSGNQIEKPAITMEESIWLKISQLSPPDEGTHYSASNLLSAAKFS